MTPTRKQSLAQTLPFDILAEIFISSLSEIHDPEEDLRLHPSQAPLLLGHICSSWRNAAWSIRQLWDSVFLPLSYFEAEQPLEELKVLDRQSLDLIRWWCEEHTSNLPSICLKCASPSQPASGSPPLTSEELLPSNPFFLSAQRLDLRLPAVELETLFFPQTHFNNLIDLRVHSPDESRKISTKFVFPSAPNLRRLYLPYYHRSESFINILLIFPWCQLTQVFIPQYMYLESWRKLMAACPNMEYGAFSVYGWAEKSMTAITMPDLRHLAISCNEIGGLTPFYRTTFPKLTSLKIASMQHNRVHSFRTLEIMLSAAPLLTELHLDFCLSFRKVSCLPFGQPLEGSRLSDLAPRLRRLVVDYIDPGDDAVGRRIIQFLQSDWLCSGWEMRLGDVVERRRLELVVSSRSYFTSSVFYENIVRDVQAHLRTHAGHPAFSVSISKNAGQELMRIEDFEEGMVRRAWTEMLGL